LIAGMSQARIFLNPNFFDLIYRTRCNAFLGANYKSFVAIFSAWLLNKVTKMRAISYDISLIIAVANLYLMALNLYLNLLLGFITYK
jgi:hypothetical protein